MRLQKRKGTVDGYEWRCRNQSKDNRHDVVRSVRKGTWFSESKLAITIILRLTRYWFGKSMNEFVMNDLKVNKNMTKLIRHVAAILRSQWANIIVALERSIDSKSAREFVQTYSIKMPSSDKDTEVRGVIVIKSKQKSKAKEKKQALLLWKKWKESRDRRNRFRVGRPTKLKDRSLRMLS
ncbi:uncharacterized protein TNCV_3465941 [Trichonephila clavipes]|nr:uncharacterized protein TNCV_3465941 [Trichonephila clavipes]